MWKALQVLLVCWIPAAFCFWRAYKIQITWAVDGIVKARGRYGAMRLWVIAGTGFLVFGLIFSFAAVDPAFMSIGKR